jgi:hypothetical protein
MERRRFVYAPVPSQTPSAHEENSMSKQKAKKEPQKTLKEKRKEKKDKKSGKGVLSL